MYYLVPVILGICFVLLGAFMCLKPEKSVKKEDANKPEAIERAKRNGSFIIILGILLALINAVRFFI